MLENLNQEQKRAVQTTEGPLLVIAGAGSGKTKVLTTRIAYLIEQKLASPPEILAITFTNKAAKEMQNRLFSLIGNLAKGMQISTFHSFGVRIIRENYQTLGYQRNFTILDANDSLTLIKKILKEMNLDIKIYNPKNIRSRITSCKNSLITPEKFKTFIASPHDEIVLKVYQKYEEKLKKSNSFDFDDLLVKPIELFRDPAILKKYQQLFRYILIDEYQDTNEAQYVLVKKLVNEKQNICVVGDESQSIYGFRGSNYRNILNFEQDFKNAQEVVLEQNYRSTQNILNMANRLIENNLQKKEKNLWTNNENGEDVIVNCLQNEHAEADYVIEQISNLLNQGTNPEHIAILYRTNAQSRVMEESVLKKGIPYRIVGNIQFYSRKEIKDLLAYLKLIYNSHDDLSLLRIINEPSRLIGSKTIGEIEKKASLNSLSLYDAIDSGKPLLFKNIIEELKKKSQDIGLTELVEEILVKSGMRDDLLNEGTAMAEIRLENLEEFKTITKEFEEKYGIIALEDFLDEISLITDNNEYQETTAQITLMTIHAAKGLEFAYVFIIGVEEGLLPHANSLFQNDDLEEERRLCYVAITRAKQKLFITYVNHRHIFGKRINAVPSRFITEMNATVACIENENSNQLVDETINYQIGEKVYNEQYGNGIIVNVTNKVLTIAFQDEIKKFIKGHKSIKKI